MIDLTGSQILESTFELNQSEKKINLTNIKSGIYFAKVILADGRTFSEKLVYVK